MNGPAHYETAENLMDDAENHRAQGDGANADWLLRLAAVHQGLALTAATALAGARPDGDHWDRMEWISTAGHPPEVTP
jgi:hypothetical protein